MYDNKMVQITVVCSVYIIHNVWTTLQCGLKFMLNVQEAKNKYHEVIWYLSWPPFLTKQITFHFVPLLQYCLKYVLSDSLYREQKHNNLACSTLLYTAVGSDIKVLSNGGMMTGNGKLKGHGENQPHCNLSHQEQNTNTYPTWTWVLLMIAQRCEDKSGWSLLYINL